MEFFKNKFLVKLIATLCLFLTLFNFAGVNRVYADDNNKVWGGVLLTPIVNLLTGLADGAMGILHNAVNGQGAAIIKINSKGWLENLGATALAFLIAVVVATVAILTVAGIAYAAGLAAAALVGGQAIFTISTGTVIGGTILGACVGVAVRKGMIPDDIYLPAFAITAEEIFNNSIPLFDVNFFSPNNKDVPQKVSKYYGSDENGIIKAFQGDDDHTDLAEYFYTKEPFYSYRLSKEETSNWMEITDKFIQSITDAAGTTKYDYSRN